jgi:hypothetical protein
MGRRGKVILDWTGTQGVEISFKRTAEGGRGQSQDFVVKRRAQ